MKAAIGDKMLKILPPSGEFQAWVSEAEVTAITDREIICTVFVDAPRIMKFDRKTGVMLDDPSQFIIRKPA